MLQLGGGAAALGGLGVAGWYAARHFLPGGAPVPVGILHSQTGTMAVSEGPVIDATMLAIEELNHSGGALGRRISPVVGDGKSDPAVFAAEAERLIRTERVAVIFGCWTSASRKAVRTVVERHDGLLFYPIQYEGLEESPRIVYLGPTPNQQLLPGLDYLTGTLGKRRLFFVGSDYVFPHAAHAIALDWLKRSPHVEVVGTEYLPLGTKAVAEVVKRIRSAQPDAILNTINGGTNFDFFRELRTNGQHSSRVPTLSVSITENELRGIAPATISGDFLAASYFQTVARAENREFIAKVQTRFGAERTTSDGMAAAYTGVRLWAQAVAAARTPEPAAVAEAVLGQEFDGPSGLIRIDRENRNAWRPWRIGKIQPDGVVALAGQSPQSVRPEPFPPTRSRAEWERFLSELYQKWNGRWQPPDAP